MKLPKTVQICGLEFEVIKDKGRRGARFNLDQQKIWIGIKGCKDDIVWQNYYNEIKEIVAVLCNNRSESTRGGSYSFHYTHKEFNMATDAEAAAIFPMIK